MPDDTFHTLEEFGNFPWDRLDPQQQGVGYGGVRAGHDCNPRKPTIEFVRDDLSADCWAIPDNLARFLEEHYNRGSEAARNEIRMALRASRD